MIVALPLWFAAGVTAIVRFGLTPPSVMFASGTNARLSEPAVTTRDASAVSGSPTVKAMAPVGTSSAVACGPMSLIVGGSSTPVTVSTNVSLTPVVPSDTVTVIVALPLWFGAGVIVIVRFGLTPPSVMFASGTNARLSELAVTTSDPSAVSGSPTVKAIAPVATASAVTWGPMSLIVGGSSTPVTVSTNVSLTAVVPSDTVTVIVALPLWFGAGVIVIVRSGLTPPSVMFASGTNAGLSELAVTTSDPSAVSGSPTVNAMRRSRRPRPLPGARCR